MPEPDARPRARLEPADPPMAPFAAGGIMLWAVAGLVLLAARTWFDAAVPARWLWICLAGVLLGFVGLAVMIRHDAHRRRRRAEDSS